MRCEIESLEYVEIVITTYCNMKCKDCSNLIQYYNDDLKKHYGYDELICSINKLLECVYKIKTLCILGGEPFLHPRINDILDYCCKNSNIEKIRVVSNSTIVPRRDVCKILENNKIRVQLNSYKKSRVNDIEKCFSNFSINYFVVDRNNEYWSDFGNPYIERTYSDLSIENQFIKCNMPCRTVIDGKFFYCPRSAHMHILFPERKTEKDYVDLFGKCSVSKKRDMINKLNSEMKYLEACKYCNSGTERFNRIEAGIQE